MELNYSQIFNSRVLDQIKSYCTLNNIEDVDKFISNCFTQGFNIEKYGLLGKTLNEGEKQVIKEVIVEKRVEIPIEVIKEVEKIVEVPVEVIKEVEKIVEVIKEVIVEKEVPVELIKEVVVEKEIIKEVPVEKIVTKIEYISDKTTEDELGGIIAKLEEEMSKKDKNLDELRRNLDEVLDKPPVEIIKEVEVIREVEKPNDKVNLLQQTIQNLTSEVRELKKKNEELENKLNDQPRQSGDIPAKFFGGSNLKL